MTLAAPPADAGHGLDAILAQAARLVTAAATLAVALDQIGIDLPPLEAAQVDQAQLRAIASLYLAAEMEQAGVIPAAETFAGLARSGAIGLDLGGAVPLLQEFWRSRYQRASAGERGHSFANLFGDSPGGDGFEQSMLLLCESLYRLDQNPLPAYGGPGQQAWVRGAATQLLAHLLGLAGGITVVMAQEILHSLREALAILKHPDLLGALGARDVWAAIERIDRMAHVRRGSIRPHVARGKAGMTVLAWLAEAAPQLDGPARALVALDDPVIVAAGEWLEAALAIQETAAAAPPTPSSASWPVRAA